MKDKTKKLIEQLEQNHDWEHGQTRGGGGTRYSSTSACRVCALRWHSFSDSQNGIENQYRFSDGETGEDLSLRQAVTRGCVE
jgi:hypothetical protein